MIQLWWRLVKFGFRLLYNEMAFTYDWVSKLVSFGQWRCWQRAALKHLKILETGLVLELAHGTGDLQLDLHAAGIRSIGYDLSPYMGRIASRKLRRHQITPRFVRGMAQQLPFASQVFDAIVCTFPTDFVFQTDTLREVRRLLHPNGRFIIVMSGVFTRNSASVRVLEKVYRATGQAADQASAHETDARFTEVVKRFADCGLAARLVREPCQGSFAHMIVADRL